MLQRDTKENVTITEDEAALYDRQIRLWGLDAQKRLRASRVLLIGVRGLGAEVAKNIVLAGVKSLLLLDHRPVTEEDFCGQFLIDRADVGKNRAESSCDRVQQLNPMVDVQADTDDVKSKSDDFFAAFDVICATCCPTAELVRINNICHAHNIMFFAGDVFGYYGYMFTDLNEHEYAEDIVSHKKKEVVKDHSTSDGEPPSKKHKGDGEDMTKTVRKRASFARLKDVLDFDWTTEASVAKLKKTPSAYFVVRVLLEFVGRHGRSPAVSHLEGDRQLLTTVRETVLSEMHLPSHVVPEDFSEYSFSELSPVCAITGGVLGQEIIKAVSQKDAPHNNFFFYNGVEGSGMVDRIG